MFRTLLYLLLLLPVAHLSAVQVATLPQSVTLSQFIDDFDAQLRAQAPSIKIGNVIQFELILDLIIALQTRYSALSQEINNVKAMIILLKQIVALHNGTDEKRHMIDRVITMLVSISVCKIAFDKMFDNLQMQRFLDVNAPALAGHILFERTQNFPGLQLLLLLTPSGIAYILNFLRGRSESMRAHQVVASPPFAPAA